MNPSCAITKLTPWYGFLRRTRDAIGNRHRDRGLHSPGPGRRIRRRDARERTPVVVLVEVRGPRDAGGNSRLQALVTLDEAPAQHMPHALLALQQIQQAKLKPSITLASWHVHEEQVGSDETETHLVSSLNLPFHSPHTSQFGKLPT